MKYLLKIEKERETDSMVEISLKQKYLEFDHIEDLIEWIYLNKNFIKNYKIYEIKEFSTKNSGIKIVENSSVNINSSNSYATFR